MLPLSLNFAACSTPYLQALFKPTISPRVLQGQSGDLQEHAKYSKLDHAGCWLRSV